jgi:uncharacterized protein YlaI
MLTCQTCGREITRDEVGLTKKLVNRGATRYFCIDCLARHFQVTREDLERKIEEFRQMGCTLFR